MISALREESEINSGSTEIGVKFIPDHSYKEGELDRSRVGKQDSVEETFPKEVMTEWDLKEAQEVTRQRSGRQEQSRQLWQEGHMGWLRCCELVQLESRAREHAAGRPQGERGGG